MIALLLQNLRARWSEWRTRAADTDWPRTWGEYFD